jgi:2-polyprenyl-3-methyl-5-hydroxy-6-metoxy-1,4-benzoquinol methylase
MFSTLQNPKIQEVRKMYNIAEYLQEKQITIEHSKENFTSMMKEIKRFKEINQSTLMLEIGVGSGWFQILCAMEGVACRGLEISQQLIDYAQEYSKQYGVELYMDLGDIEESDIGTSKYDIIIADSVFEHVKNWQKGLKRIFAALRPGGLLYFVSTNKFSFKSGEYNFPLYGWLPDNWRYRLRVARQGENIMEWGIDFHQFTHFQLRQFFSKSGFSRVFDLIDVLDPDNLNHPTPQKRLFLKTVKKFRLLKHLALLFAPGTHFICIK